MWAYHFVKEKGASPALPRKVKVKLQVSTQTEPTQNLLFPLLSPSSPVLISVKSDSVLPGTQAKPLLDCALYSHPVPNPSANLTVTAFQMFPESEASCRLHAVHLAEPSSLTWTRGGLQMALLLPSLLPFSTEGRCNTEGRLLLSKDNSDWGDFSAQNL